MTVLLIDDDADDRELFRDAVYEIDPAHICITESSCKKAMGHLLNSLNKLPGIIFLDINMPIVNGWDSLGQLKTNDSVSSIPVIMYSTSFQIGDIEKAKNAGASGMITKPDNFELLKQTLSSLFDKQQFTAF